MKIEKIDISKLVHDPANARKHSDKNIDAIKGSLIRFGQQKPIVVTGDNIVIAGNGTLEAAKQLDWKKIEIVRTKLSGLDLVAYGLADNRTSELAEWNEDVLGKLLHGLRENDFDLTSIGFDTSKLDEINISSLDDFKQLIELQDEIKKEVDDEKKYSDINTENEFMLLITCVDENEQQSLYDEFMNRGVECKIM